MSVKSLEELIETIESVSFYEIFGVFGSDLIKHTSDQDPNTSRGKGILGDFI
ncbi:hypothetical protein Scep_023477 [Stephania cephalantha]|uniref:Uncharacterized protein n=1 Tax=Stephania cephalantha TaxID=152367 RepID=A0AAP0HWB5_9MAGN